MIKIIPFKQKQERDELLSGRWPSTYVFVTHGLITIDTCGGQVSIVHGHCAGEYDLHGVSAYFLVNKEVSHYYDGCSMLCKSKHEENVKNKFFHPVLITFGT
jgi:hypothetical protein